MERGELKRILDTCERLAKSKDTPPQFREWIDEKLLDFGIAAYSMDGEGNITNHPTGGLIIISSNKDVSNGLAVSNPPAFNCVDASETLFSSKIEDELTNLMQFILACSTRARVIPAFIDASPVLMENEVCMNLHNVVDSGSTIHGLSLIGVARTAGMKLVNVHDEGNFKNMGSFSNPLAMNVLEQGLLTGIILDIHVSMFIKSEMLNKLLKNLQTTMLK